MHKADKDLRAHSLPLWLVPSSSRALLTEDPGVADRAGELRHSPKSTEESRLNQWQALKLDEKGCHSFHPPWKTASSHGFAASALFFLKVWQEHSNFKRE